MTIAKKPNLAAEGLARLVNDYQIKRNISGILASWLRAAKRLDDLAVDTIYAHVLATAIGAQLDTAGALIGEPRNGALDDDYRKTLYLSARARNSTGRTIDTFEIVALLLGNQDFLYAESWPGGYDVTIYSFPSAPLVFQLARLLGFAKPAGFRATLLESPQPAANVMRWGSSVTATGRGPACVAFPASVTSTFINAVEIKSP